MNGIELKKRTERWIYGFLSQLPLTNEILEKSKLALGQLELERLRGVIIFCINALALSLKDAGKAGEVLEIIPPYEKIFLLPRKESDSLCDSLIDEEKAPVTVYWPKETPKQRRILMGILYLLSYNDGETGLLVLLARGCLEFPRKEEEMSKKFLKTAISIAQGLLNVDESDFIIPSK